MYMADTVSDEGIQKGFLSGVIKRMQSWNSPNLGKRHAHLSYNSVYQYCWVCSS